jgi:hypothetical protein
MGNCFCDLGQCIFDVNEYNDKTIIFIPNKLDYKFTKSTYTSDSLTVQNLVKNENFDINKIILMYAIGTYENTIATTSAAFLPIDIASMSNTLTVQYVDTILSLNANLTSKSQYFFREKNLLIFKLYRKEKIFYFNKEIYILSILYCLKKKNISCFSF